MLLASSSAIVAHNEHAPHGDTGLLAHLPEIALHLLNQVLGIVQLHVRRQSGAARGWGQSIGGLAGPIPGLVAGILRVADLAEPGVLRLVSVLNVQHIDGRLGVADHVAQ